MTGMEQIAAERQLYGTAHNAQRNLGEYLKAAQCYAMPPEIRDLEGYKAVWHDGYADKSWLVTVPRNWPWDGWMWKPSTRESDLVKAGALMLAESDRIMVEVDRIAAEIDRLTGEGEE